MNFKKEFHGLTLKNEFWATAKATHGYEFQILMKNLKNKKDDKPFEWVCQIPLSQ